MKPKVYLETSVISYLAARPSRDLLVAANQQITHEWWETHRQKFDLFISSLVVQEISRGNAEAASRRMQAVSGIALLQLDELTVLLSKSLVEQGVVPIRAAEDAMHIAVAARKGMDYLLTWNFRHIANAAIRVDIEKVCRAAGYEPPIICSPQELMED
jgi:predicted nucleic acid-binding protein